MQRKTRKGKAGDVDAVAIYLSAEHSLRQEWRGFLIVFSPQVNVSNQFL